MKKLFFCLLGGAMMLNSCTDDSGVFVPDGIKEPTLPVETKPNEVIKGDVFSKLNLDYPGLEKVKQHYEAGEHYLAAKELLEYYRGRADILNPNVNLVVPTASAVDMNKANQALDYKFCVAKYVSKEGSTDDLDVYYSFKKEDGTINWGWKPDNKDVDREFLYQQHRHQWMEPQAKAYAVTKNEAYFKNWVDVYTSWMAAYPCPNKAFEDPKIYNLEPGYEWKALQPSFRVLTQLNIFPYYLPSPNFTPDWLCVFLNAFAESVEMIRMNYIKEGNVLITQGQAVTLAGILMPEFKNSESWVTNGLKAMSIDEQFRTDGVHIDLDFGYHISAVSDYLNVYDVALINGKSGLVPSEFISKLKSAMNFVQDMIYPDYTVDNFNDTKSSSYKKSTLMNRLKEYLAKFPDDEELRWMAWEGSKGGKKPSWKSKAYTDAGYYMFRSREWGKDKGMMMIFKNNENSSRKWHCQPDNGTFSLWFRGTNFLPDAGHFSYNDPDPTGKRPLYRRSDMHNTMSIYNKRIYETQQLGKFLKQESTADYEVIVTENTPYKAGQKIKDEDFTPKGDIKHRRAVFFVNDEFFAIVDEAFSTSNEDTDVPVNFNYHLYSEGKEPVIDDENKTVKTDLKSNNLLIKAFSETNTDCFSVAKPAESDIAVSVVSGSTIGEVRNWVTVNEKLEAGKAVRMITILYPSAGAATSKNIEAQFTDNAEGSAGTMHNGISAKVTVDGKEYNLNYTLN